jgi:pre-mRNA-splicing factor ATP-dependent RNA helicase DHX38/PRP16
MCQESMRQADAEDVERKRCSVAHGLLMASTTESDAEAAFIHGVAIQLSRELNTQNPNDTLARNVVALAQAHAPTQFAQAAAGFGLRRAPFLDALYAEISAHVAQTTTAQPVQGIVVHDSDVLAPEPVRQGGLVRKDAVRAPHLPRWRYH